MSHFPASRSTAHCGRGSAVSTLVVTHYSIVISIREALSFGSSRRPERDQNSVVTIPRSGRRKCILYLPDLMPHLAAAPRVLYYRLRMTEPRRTTTARETSAPAQSGRRPRTTIAKAAGGERSSSRLGIRSLRWQSARRTRNHRRLQGDPLEPRRRRHCPAQAGWPHRKGVRESSMYAVGRDGATRRV